jgi:hypothetical protein
MLNLLNQLAALLPLSSAGYLAALEVDQSYAQVTLFLALHEHGAFVQQFLGLWLVPLGYVVFRSRFFPRVLGILLVISGLGYPIDAVMFFLFPDFDVTISQFTFAGEVFFMLWLLTKGVDVKQWEERALESV